MSEHCMNVQTQALHVAAHRPRTISAFRDSAGHLETPRGWGEAAAQSFLSGIPLNFRGCPSRTARTAAGWSSLGVCLTAEIADGQEKKHEKKTKGKCTAEGCAWPLDISRFPSPEVARRRSRLMTVAQLGHSRKSISKFRKCLKKRNLEGRLTWQAV